MLESIEFGLMYGFMFFLIDVYKKYEIVCCYFLERMYCKLSDFYNMMLFV